MKRRFEFHTTPLRSSLPTKRVFGDPARTRGKRLRRNSLLAVVAITLWILLFFFGGRPSNSTSGGLVSQVSTLPGSYTLIGAGDTIETSPKLPSATHECDSRPYESFSAMASTVTSRKVFAHVPVSIEWSFQSIERSCGAINVLVPDWITLTEKSDGLHIQTVSADTRLPVEAQAKRWADQLQVMPRVQISPLTASSSFASAITNNSGIRSVTKDMQAALVGLEADGGCIDVSELPADIATATGQFLVSVREMMSKSRLQSCLVVGWNSPLLLDRSITEGFDQIIVKAFFEAWVGSTPQPLSENRWFSETVAQALRAIDEDKLVIALGSFSTLWEAGNPVPARLPYAEAMAKISDANAELVFNPNVSGSSATQISAKGRRQALWMLDVASAYNQLVELESQGVNQVAIWSLGFEDPAIWNLLSSENPQETLTSPQATFVVLEDYVRYQGKGAALRVLKRPQMGFRNFTFDASSKQITNQAYVRYPEPYILERYGATEPNQLILTFDDGPHPDYTPRILDILEETQTPAAFFVLGQSVMAEPDILKRIFEDGHEVGAHSFSHPRMDLISNARTALEHDLADRVIASAIGKRTLLYREPFLRSGGPISARRVSPLEYVQRRGSVVFGMDVVPKDWEGLTSQEITDYVVREVELGNGRVILLHDGGKDREASVEALPEIISQLRARGYEFTTIANALKVRETQLLEPVNRAQQRFDRFSFTIASGAFNGVVIVFWFVLMVALLRSLSVFVLAMARKRHRGAATGGGEPKVAVVIPAFNEESGIKNCIESALASSYSNFEVVVVNDGSSDDTLNKVFSFKHKKNVRVVMQPNQGKWAALNRALLGLDAEIAVCIDADTQIQPDAISRLVEHFLDPRIGAVAGKIVVGNQVNLLTRMQALEYATSQNFDRLAFDAINGIMVVPGALGAWRVSALHKAGLFTGDTLTEDSDLTISVNRAGYRVVYDELAVALTEAPESIRGLITQRLRWSLGMLQAAWKHRCAIRERRSIGLISIPDMFTFGYLLPLLAPIADFFVVVLLYNCFQGSWVGEVGVHPEGLSPSFVWALLALPCVELMIAAYAVRRDNHASAALLLVWPLQRVLYRPLLYLTVIRTVVRALTGSLASWGRSKRLGHDFLRLESSV